MPEEEVNMPNPPVLPESVIAQVLREMESASQQRQALTQQSASAAMNAPSGLLEPGQNSFADAVRNPSQGQLDATVAGLLGALNPNSNAPIATGIASGLSALQTRRAGDLASKQAAFKLQTDALKDRIDTLSKTATALGTVGNLGINREDLARKVAADKFDVEEKNRRFGLDVAKERDIVEDVVGTDEFGSPIKAQFSVNPITGTKTRLTGGIPSTGQEQRTQSKESLSKGSVALKEGLGLFFDKDLHQIFGPIEMRPMLGKLTEGAIGGKAKLLQGRYDRFVENRILDVARIVAPVSDVDAQMLKETLAPSKTFGSAEEARTWFTQEFAPKTIQILRFNASPLAAYKAGSQFINEGLKAGMDYNEAVDMLGNMPFIEEVTGFSGSPSGIYTPFNKDDPLHGRAIPAEVVEALAKANKQSVSDFVAARNLSRVK